MARERVDSDTIERRGLLSRLRSEYVRASIAVVCGLAGAFIGAAVIPHSLGAGLFMTLTWDVLSVCYLTTTWLVFARMKAPQLRRWAVTETRPRPGWLVLAMGGRITPRSMVQTGGFAALLVAGYLLPRVGNFDPSLRLPTLLLGILAVFLAWLTVHTAYTLHYALLYYTKEHGSGLSFRDCKDPAFWEFAYFAFSVGKTLGTTDVAVTSSTMRRSVLAHGLFSFLFNTIVLALTVTFITP